MKKTVVALALAAFLLASAVIPVFSADKKYGSLLLLGDSITYGYGLEGTRDTCASYGNQLRKYLDISESNFTNAAVNGYTSADLLALLPSLTEKVKNAGLIVVSIGGNDLLHILWNAASAVLGSGWTYADVTAGLNNPAYVEKLKKYITVEAVTDAIISYSANLESIISFIRQNNAVAKVIFLAQYDPMSGAPGLEEIGAISSGSISLLNAAMRGAAKEGECTYLDIRTPFEGKGPEWTNILAGDIHPNITGHKMIFQYIVNYLENGLQPDGTPEETGTASTTEIQVQVAVTENEQKTTETQDVTSADSENAITDTSPRKNGCGSAAAGAFSLVSLGLCAMFIRKKK
jgi:lysophospholipase L1-like esterase